VNGAKFTSGEGHAKGTSKSKAQQEFEPINHEELLDTLLDGIQPVDFRELTETTGNDKLSNKHYLVTCIEQVLITARNNSWGLCTNNEAIYLYNRAYWKAIDEPTFQVFLGRAAERMGIDRHNARYYQYREQLYKQFLSAANLHRPEPDSDTVLINLQNGTFEIGADAQRLRSPEPADFLTYQLPFEYDPSADAPLFHTYLNHVLPDPILQKILAEYLAYLFVRPSVLKLEKMLLIYGSGANGKSVLFDIVNALLGSQNVCSYSLQSLTDESGYYRAMLADKLVNYASEINGKLESASFKALVSGEPIHARLPYGNPFTLTKYAKLIFNCNELPKEVEQTHAFFRRFLIIPFDVTIPEAEQDKQLSQRIIRSELSGVFNWMLSGLARLLTEGNFTHSDVVEKQTDDYKRQSDSVLMFVDEEGWVEDLSQFKDLKTVYGEYKGYCEECGYMKCSLRKFSDRLRRQGFKMERKNYGFVVYMNRKVFVK